MRQIFINKSLNFCALFGLTMLLLSGCASTSKKPEVILSQPKVTAPILAAVDQQAYDKALKLMAAKSYVNAKNIFTDLIKTYPNLAGAYVNLAFIHKAELNETLAEKNIESALAINPNNVDALIQLADWSQKKGDFNKVESYLLTAEAIDETNEVVQYNLAVVYELYLQQYADAIDHYKKYIALTSNDDKKIVKRWIKLLERK